VDPADLAIRLRVIVGNALRASFVAVVAQFVASVCLPAGAQTEAVRAPLAIAVNTVDKGVRMVLIANGDFLIARDDVDDLALGAVVAARKPPAGPYVSLNALAPLLTYVYEVSKAALVITVQPQYLPATSLDLGNGSGYSISRSPSAFLNYGLVLAAHERGDLATQLGSTFGAGVASATFNDVDGQYRATNVNWTVDDPAALTTFVAGDAYVDNGDLLGGNVIRGLTFERNFGLMPYGESRNATRAVGGYTATPSTADVYVNGQLVSEVQLAPGPFNLANLPLANGASDAQVVVRDAFGNVATFSQSYYEGVRLLPRGVSDFSYSAGDPQDGRGRSLGPFEFAGTYDRGLSDAATLGVRAEASHDVVDYGPALALASRYGELDVIGLESDAGGVTGRAGEIAYDYAARRFGFNAALEFQSAGYANASLPPSADRDLSRLVAGVELPAGRQSFSFHLTSSDDRDEGRETGYGVQTSFRLTRQASLSVDFERQHGTQGSYGNFFTTLVLPFGRRDDTVATVSTDSSGSGTSMTYALERGARPDLPLGYDLSLNEGGAASTSLEQATYESSFGTYSAEQTTSRGTSSTRLDAAGALVFADGHVLASRPLTESYVIADTDGIAGVPVAANGVTVGRTNGAGLLVIPEVAPFSLNTISVDPSNLTLDTTFDNAQETVAPGYLAAGIARFRAERTQSFVGTVSLLVAGTPHVPSFGTLTVSLAGGASASSELGDDGAFYFANLPLGPHPAHVDAPAGICDLTVVVPITKDPYVRLGRLTCTVAPSPSPSSQS